MNITLSINCDFESVFLVNGRLSEGGEIFYGENEVVYITVLPLSALLLPYTVKLLGGKVKCNGELCKCYRLSQDRFYLKVSPRYNYVYSVGSSQEPTPLDLVERFFDYIRDKNTDAARGCISRELSDSINDQSLLGFFDGFTDIVADNRSKGLYYLIDKNGSGILYEFVVKNGVVDNIIEL